MLPDVVWLPLMYNNIFKCNEQINAEENDFQTHKWAQTNDRHKILLYHICFVSNGDQGCSVIKLAKGIKPSETEKRRLELLLINVK